jgi:outer membrane protein OmpA-like peptidoglycan-associated protein
MISRDSGFFWPSYADLMTSLFFIMLVLYVVTVVVMQGTIGVDAQKFKQIRNIEQALRQLDARYYAYDAQNKRFKLKADVNFPSNQASIALLPDAVQTDLLDAGRQLYGKMQTLVKNRNVDYLIVIEGNTQRNAFNYKSRPDIGYTLSYQRALALHNFWQANGLNFNRFENCEILIAGSGYFSKSREADEERNRRFTIQITAKVGEFKGR